MYPPKRVLYRSQNETKLIETSLVRTNSGSLMVTRVNNQNVYVPGLTSVMKYSTDIAARAQHTKWVKAVIEGKEDQTVEEIAAA